MSLLQLLGLLLVLLFHLLRSSVVRLLFRQLLVLLILLLLKFLPFLVLLRSQLCLLLLVFLVELRVPRIWRRRTLRWRKILRVDRRSRRRRSAARLATIFWSLVRRSSFFRLNYSAAAEFPRLRGGGDGRRPREGRG